MKLKKLMAAVLSFSLVCGAVPFNNAFINDSAVYAEEEYTEGTYGPLSYTNYGDYIAITDCDESATEVEIPSEIDGVPVTSIGEYAFSWCELLTSITIPDSVTSIGGDAFSGCLSLISINIPESVVNFGYWAFYSTPWLENKRNENPLVIINNVLVDGLTCTGDIIIPEGVTKITTDAFCQSAVGGFVGTSPEPSASITSVQLPDTLKIIESMAFARCNNLTEVVIPESVDCIESLAFLQCENLKSLVILNPNCDMELVPLFATGWKNLTIYGYENTPLQTRAEACISEMTESYTTGATFSFSPISNIYGDINTDGVIDSSDASSVLAEYALLSTGSEKSFSQVQTISADVNNDGAVDSSDASSILAYYAFVSTGGEGSLAEFLSNL